MTDRLTVTVAVDGGIAPFPGLARPFAVDAAELPAKDAAELARLVDESGFFELPEQRPHGGPDARTYTVTVQRGKKSRTLTLTDPLPNTALRRLINIVEQRRRAR
jgi:hypothetical protein